MILYKRTILSHLKSFFAMIKKEFLIVIRYPLNFFGQFVSTIFWILIFVFAVIPYAGPNGNGNSMYLFTGSILWGSTMFFMFSDAIWAIGMSIFWEQRTGTLEQIFLAPVKQWLILIARGIRATIVDSVIILWMILMIYSFTGFFVAVNPLIGLYILILSIITFLGFGFMYAALVIWIKQPHMISNVLQFVFLILCAMFFPFSVLPPQILVVSKLIPFSYNVDAFRAAMLGLQPELLPSKMILLGFEFSAMELELIILHISTVSFVLIGFWLYRYAVKVASKRGTLGFH